MNRALAPADIPHYDPPLGQMGMAEGEPRPSRRCLPVIPPWSRTPALCRRDTSPPNPG